MIYFLCVLLTIVIMFMKTDKWSGDLLFGVIIVSLIFAILRVGGWL